MIDLQVGIEIDALMRQVKNYRETTQEIAALEALAEETAIVPLTPAPEGLTELEVKVEPVPGEQFTDNNEATYTVNFE